MLTPGTLLVWAAIALVGYAGWRLVARRLFSVEARERRRRRKSYRRIESRRHGATVKLAVKVDRP